MSEPFKLATVSSGGSPTYVALVLGERAIALNPALERFGAAGRTRRLAVASMLDLLADWETNFALLQELVAFLGADGIDGERWRGAVSPVASLAIHAPVPRPPKMLYAAINYPPPRPPKPRRDLRGCQAAYVREELELRRRSL